MGDGFPVYGLHFTVFGKQVIQNPIRTDRAEGKDERSHQVVRSAAIDAGDARQHGGHHIAEVIIGYGVTGKPGVLWRKGWGAQNAVDESQFHRLFGTGQFGIGGAGEGKKCKGGEK